MSKDEKIRGTYLSQMGPQAETFWLTLYYIVFYKVQDGHEHKQSGISPGSSEI